MAVATWKQIEALTLELIRSSPPPSASSASAASSASPVSSASAEASVPEMRKMPLREILKEAWPKLGLEGLAALLNAHVSAGWFVRHDKRVKGPCPSGSAKCAGEPEAAWLLYRADGGPPHVRCNHKESCGFNRTVWQILADRFPSKRDCLEIIAKAAGLELDTQAPEFEDEPEKDPRPVIDVTPELARMAAAVETILVADGVPVYHKTRMLVRVAHDRGQARIEEIPLPQILSLIGEHARWRRLKKDRKGSFFVKAPVDVAQVLATQASWNFPELERVITAPTLRPDGSVLDKPGYDPSSRLLYEPDREYPPIPESPSLEDAKKALACLEEPFCDFPFVDGRADLAAAVSLVMTCVAKSAIDGNTPLFVVRANLAGSGKNMLADVAGLVAFGEAAPRLDAADDNEEWRKQITTAVVSGAAFVVIDEAEILSSKAFAKALTEQIWTDRLLSTNKLFRAPRPIFASCGNNTQVKGDLERRSLPIELRSPMENPEDRTTFRHDPLEAWVLAERPRLVVAVLTLFRAYHAAGRPKQKFERGFGSFQAWSNLVRSTLVWAGAVDPCSTRDRMRAEGGGTDEELGVTLQVWSEKLGAEPHTLADIARLCEHDHELLAAFLNLDQKSDGKFFDKKRIGAQIRRHKNKIVNGLRLEACGMDRTKAMKWRIVTTSEISEPRRPPFTGTQGLTTDLRSTPFSETLTPRQTTALPLLDTTPLAVCGEPAESLFKCTGTEKVQKGGENQGKDPNTGEKLCIMGGLEAEFDSANTFNTASADGNRQPQRLDVPENRAEYDLAPDDDGAW